MPGLEDLLAACGDNPAASAMLMMLFGCAAIVVSVMALVIRRLYADAKVALDAVGKMQEIYLESARADTVMTARIEGAIHAVERLADGYGRRPGR